ncbi:glucan endo-1,3-alpha-glucosidase Agn2 [Schizosaccharomyces japonicus yFS275]|uniref:Glucan endo-1,3-alpha-glucosidase Agn2 n=1 Tax=Schizosaccharomyces japonicus (strain yFS275 / FY16936) TaxID=402676 RepID=B6K100_SCHJY|nr:glucan endo-1,3-alpha-glucosidase Agn2 [Schizosaccharomyces japonicus yFS275]EEB07621.2 glucan endo-1,3-alpha-glucosidase Agn2 [Schizosaccharomyces japonicus yFS275]
MQTLSMTHHKSLGDILRSPLRHMKWYKSKHHHPHHKSPKRDETVVGPQTYNVGEKDVVAHFMMGLTYTYSQSDFETDITNAVAAGVDGFALNIGNDYWMMSKLELVYAAADALSLDFYLFISLDMAVMADVSADTIVSYITTFASRTHQATINNCVLVGTFAGETLMLGGTSVNEGWQTNFKDALASKGVNAFFMPSWSLDANTIYQNYPVADGFMKWNAWPYFTSTPLSVAEDQIYLKNARSVGKKYMATISPLFFTHFTSKNYTFFSEGLWYQRWMDLITLQPDYIEVLTWNDYGESHYVGPTNYSADFPVDGQTSHAWVDAFSHTAIGRTLPYFISMYKNNTTGLPPDYDGARRLFFMHRIHSISATATSDPIGKPQNVENLQDLITLISFSPVGYNVRVSIGATVLGTVWMPAGVSSGSVSFSNKGVAVAGLPRYEILNDTTVVAVGYSPLAILDNSAVVQYNFNFCSGELVW